MVAGPAKAVRSVLLTLAVLSGTTLLLAGPRANSANGHGQNGEIGKSAPQAGSARGLPVLWSEPRDIGHRDLFYGPGGEEHQPASVFTFVAEDLDGSNPKFNVRDDAGMKWKIKLGAEARPETVASRLVWALGYSAEEDYFVGEVLVRGMPLHLHRGQRLVGTGGPIRNVRLKREPDDRKKIGNWRWRDNPFTGTRELNGLRVLMAVINNYDLKDVNNAIHERKRHNTAGADELVYEVSDLGSSFGSAGLERTDVSKGNLEAYRRTQFIKKATPDEVDFNVPRRADWIVLANVPEFFMRLGLRWIGQQIPREDAKWMGHLLAQLSSDQIRDAFRAAGYSAQEIDGFTAVLESRIAQLNQL
ncbi:MAG TPA: hypothetical protein VG815_19525 [Chloroflexota bacterium]|nr:hypothetical protein [Chloroflexota bacterium]